jgi:hypothetical protein
VAKTKRFPIRHISIDIYLPSAAKAHPWLDTMFCNLFRRSLLCYVMAVLCTAACATAWADAPAYELPCPEPSPCCPQFRVREQDQVWVVSSRHLGCPTFAAADSLQVWQYEKGIWQPSNIADFYATDSKDVVTTAYIHGNRIDAGQANADGLAVYFQLVGKFDHLRATRFVIYSWPSDQIKGPLKDVRSKSYRANEEAFLFSRFLGRINKDVPLGLVGFSYGARITIGGLHLMGGGSFNGRATEPGPGQPIRVALWAAAEHNDWPLPGHAHGQALGMADHWFITINGCDPALARYQAIDKCEKPCALGYAGLAGGLPPDLARRVEFMNVSNIVGSSHDMERYLYSPVIAERTRQEILWYSPAPPKP